MKIKTKFQPKLIEDLGWKKVRDSSKQKHRIGVYECQYCNTEFEANMYSVLSGSTKSCGCQRGKGQLKHGLEANRFYNTWYSMKQRCTSIISKAYKHYGGRGITVCDEWLDVRNFVAWAESTHPNISGVSLDRIDNNKGYTPENCRWVDNTIQNTNKRINIRNTSGVVGVSQRRGEGNWSASLGIHGTKVYIGTFKTKEEATYARDNYIIENKLPNKLSAEYKKDINE